MSFDSSLVVQQGAVDTFCFDVSGLNMVTSIINICPELSDGDVGFTILPGLAPCVAYSGDFLGIDTFCEQICDANIGFCDIFLTALTAASGFLPLTGFRQCISAQAFYFYRACQFCFS